jgi:hypothetical protein
VDKAAVINVTRIANLQDSLKKLHCDFRVQTLTLQCIHTSCKLGSMASLQCQRSKTHKRLRMMVTLTE